VGQRRVNSKKIKTALIGAGRIAWSLELDPLRYKPCTHIGALKLLQKKFPIEWIGICDIDPEKSVKAPRFINKPDIYTTTSYEKLIDMNPDLLVIASSSESHYTILKYALENKIKSIVIEKPIVLRPEEARIIENLSIKNRARVYINFERRYHKKYTTLKKIIETEKPLGKAIFYRGTISCSNPELYYKNSHNEGVLLHDTTHLVDLSQFLFGKVINHRKPEKKNRPPKQTHLLQLDHKSISGEILSLSAVPYFHFEIEILFQKGRIRAGNGMFLVEKSTKSPHYKNFQSLCKKESTNLEVQNQRDNPFIRLYSDLLGQHNGPTDLYDISNLKDACQNIIYLA